MNFRLTKQNKEKSNSKIGRTIQNIYIILQCKIRFTNLFRKPLK